MFSKTLTVAVASVALATPAYAQDDSTAAAYSGPRAEIRLGGEFLGGGVQSNVVDEDRGDFGDDRGANGVLGGVEIGYDHAVAQGVVLGIYAGAEYTDTEIFSAANRPYRFDSGHNLYAGARIGMPLSRGAMLYAKGGFSQGKFDPEFLTGSDPTLFDDYDSSRSGFHVGAGAEVPFMSRGYFRAEYVYHEYDTFDVGTTLELPFNRHQLVASLGMRF
jgi:outer membrane immunogenic protein